MKEQPVAAISRRKIEAELYGQLYETISNKSGKEKALEIIRENLKTSAFQAGQNFAKTAENEPNLKHFSSIVEVWKTGDAIKVAEMSIEDNLLKIDVIRCNYQQAYYDMGLPDELCKLLSCSRDEPFAKGYSKNLRMVRETTLAEGGKCCPFRFYWD
ncbi:L-2-amino-thiazoline-4-carboxylic acid hydrolase [Maridesulfovibrio ferrireducens]|uniref:L-2-amino-thiazoline-4-carboxylic acid hydrolase n=1 Tax=Maridesulfovibrio ferrireducens TaxID=246191 RepID=A0A1G9I9X0_9BACT|nr:L-2-amino-thiazoline-4-carboxylic acid hydrolase [Maridesulfovibrio ferrireducens]SDL21896.1 L-2-amino-thiazoline-4-carboxylic acid hydrolase [Maridesulfovibrio ferrireducens]